MIADRGEVSGDYLYYRCPWGIASEAKTMVEARVKVVSGNNCIIMANGITGERLVLTPGNVHLYHHSKLQHAMDTTDDFHLYRVVIQGADMQVFVDDVLRIDAPGTFTQRSGYPKNELAFGACNSPGTGEAIWSHVRACTQNASLHDAVVQVRVKK